MKYLYLIIILSLIGCAGETPPVYERGYFMFDTGNVKAVKDSLKAYKKGPDNVAALLVTANQKKLAEYMNECIQVMHTDGKALIFCNGLDSVTRVKDLGIATYHGEFKEDIKIDISNYLTSDGHLKSLIQGVPE